MLRFLEKSCSLLLCLLFLAVMLAIDFSVTRTNLYAVIHEYRLTAQGRVGVVSALDVLLSASSLRILAVVGLTVLYPVSRPSLDGSKGLLIRCFCIIVFYWACQVVLNMSNASPPGVIYLAPAAAVAIVTWADTPDIPSSWNRLWRRFHPRSLNELPARQLLPLLVIAMVCVPEALASARAVHINYLVSSGTIETITISANKGVGFKIRRDSYDGPLAPYLNRAIKAIEELGETRETIVNLDNENPFPTLFLAPDPKGVWVWWDFKFRNVPVGYRLSWREIIGDACIVAEPTHSPTEPVKYCSEPLKEAVRTHLTSAFTIVYEDELWKIWKRSPGCSATGGQPD